MGNSFGTVESAIAKFRSRASWNDRLAHWERPASAFEELKIQRAASQARAIVSANSWLNSNKVKVNPQGSYHNNTNVRLEADMDLRVELPGIKTVYLDNLTPKEVDGKLGYFLDGGSFSQTANRARHELEVDLIKYYGQGAVNSAGNKALTVKGLSGSRADCDLVPVFSLHVISQGVGGDFHVDKGVAIFGKDESWTFNFPMQHCENGKLKRQRTAHRFKKCVRMLKQLNYELAKMEMIPKRMPSFFIECIVYAVEDWIFLVESDDRYDRLIRILANVQSCLENPAWIRNATEVNEIKFLFREKQAWTELEAKRFVAAALARLGS